MELEPIITLKDVCVHYVTRENLFRRARVNVLNNVCFEVFRGETVSISGRNGAGKSTLLKVLAGIYKPDSGKIDSHANRVSLLALQVGFDANLTGKDNAFMTGLMMGYSRSFVKRRVESIKEYSELGDWFDRPIKTYSAGMRARLGFSSAISYRPEVLLIDEVLGVGDSAFRGKAKQTIKELTSSDLTVIIVSHSNEFVEEVSDRSLSLIDGEIVG